MAVKTTGAEFKRFYFDPEFWPEGEEYWHEDDTITFDGEVVDSIDTDALADDAKVTIEGGTVFGPKWEDGAGPSLDAYFRRWKKKQATVSFLVECNTEKAEAVKAAIRAAGGKV